MQEYTRGDVEFLAMELFSREHGDNRSWDTWEDQTSFRIRARNLLEKPIDPVVASIMESPVAPSSMLEVLDRAEAKVKPKRATRSRDSAID